MVKCKFYHMLPAGVEMFHSMNLMMPRESDGDLLHFIDGFSPHPIHHCVSSKKFLPNGSTLIYFTACESLISWSLFHKSSTGNVYR